MRKQKVLAEEFQFYFSDVDNLVLVESLEDGTVRVRHTRDNLSEQRKCFFIRELATEGFIPDEYQRFSGSTDDSNKVLWIKDYSWLKSRFPSRRLTHRMMGVLLVASFILWVAMMRVLIVAQSNTTKPTAIIPSAFARPGAHQSQPPRV